MSQETKAPAESNPPAVWYSGTERIEAPKERTPAQRAADRERAVRMRGNDHGRRGRIWRDAVRRALYRRVDDKSGERFVDKIARRMVEDAAMEQSDIDRDVAAVVVQARKEIGDRLDGRAVSTTEHTGANGAPISILIGPADIKVL